MLSQNAKSKSSHSFSLKCYEKTKYTKLFMIAEQLMADNFCVVCYPK
jgi:hypothetical protein